MRKRITAGWVKTSRDISQSYYNLIVIESNHKFYVQGSRFYFDFIRAVNAVGYEVRILPDFAGFLKNPFDKSLLSSRVCRFLDESNIKTDEDISRLELKNLKTIKGFGARAFNEVSRYKQYIDGKKRENRRARAIRNN